MRVNRFAGAFALSIFSLSLTFSQVFLEADSTRDAYTSIRARGYGYEVPDCNHPVRHITEAWDHDLRKFVFAFTLHRDKDDDRCINFDRQRCEIKTDSHSPQSMQGSRRETHVYRWKFKLAAGFQPSLNFCHLHQIKTDSGAPKTGTPLITITPRRGTPDKLQVIFSVQRGQRGGGILKEMDLEPFLGIWVEAYERARFDVRGSYELVIRRVSDDSVLLSCHSDLPDLWSEKSHFNRPKWGIYRSLNSREYLRDESVLFADFSLAEGDRVNLPAIPSKPAASNLPSGVVTITWADNSDNEDQFRIDRSTDGVLWAYLGTARTNEAGYTDTELASGSVYYYRVRAENAFGNSSFTAPVKLVVKVSHGSEK